MTQLAALFLLLSGMASLTYQVVWVRLLGLTMGSTSASISTVLAAFFMGLALGSYLAERITRNHIGNLTVYISLEVVIGVAGLLLLPVLLNLQDVLVYLPGTSSSLTTKFFVTVALLIIPTICMGATFPVMASILIRKQDEVGLRVSQLYSLNTAGAVLGAALAGFIFVPNWGLDGSIYIAFSINMLIVLMGLHLNKRIKLPPLEAPVLSKVDTFDTSLYKNRTVIEDAPFRFRALAILFLTGLVAIATEVGWTKYLSIFTGTTIYGFAAILTIFLLGIASGSWSVKNHLERLQRPELVMAFGLMLLGVSLLLTRAGLNLIPPIYQAINHLPASATIKHEIKYLIVFILIFPPTFIFGALFPLNLKLYCGNLHGVRARIGKAYAVNTVASIVGSLVAGFWLIPHYGTDFLLMTMAMIILVSPVLFTFSIKGTVLRAAFTSLITLIVASATFLPNISYKELIASVQYRYDKEAQSGKEPKFLFLKEGKTGVISMVTYNGRHVKLQNNGLNESFIDLEDENNVLLVETLLGIVPYLMHHNPKSAFVVGFGGGVTTKALTHTQLEQIKVVELEPAVVEAGRAIAGGEIEVLTDPRVSLEFNDARNTLLLENTKYDLIAAQPSHPWLARASNVFTQEFFELVKSRLNEGGIYSQWVNLFNMDATTLRSIFNAFYTVFPEGFSFANLDSGDFILFGSKQKMVFNYERMNMRLNEPAIRKALSYHNIHEAQDLLWYFSLSREEALTASQGVPANSDTNILSEVRLSALDGDGKGSENPYEFLKKNYNLSVSSYLDGDIVVKLDKLANYFFKWDGYHATEYLVKQMKTFDEVMARGIKYESLWRKGAYKEAFKLYASHDTWPDKTHYQQAIAFLDANEIINAQQTAVRIVNEQQRGGILARILYYTQNWQTLKDLSVEGADAQQWQLLGLARSDQKSAALQLRKINNYSSLEYPQLKVLVQYFAGQELAKPFNFFTRLLAKKMLERVIRLLIIGNDALNFNDVKTAKVMLKKIEEYGDSVDGAAALRLRITGFK